MRFGVCCGPEHVFALQELGYDYVEPSLAGVVSLAERDFRETERMVADAPLKAEAFNCFLPGELKVVGPAVDWPRIRDYLACGMERASRLGGRLIVFGSGGARSIPDGFSREKARDQLAEFLGRASEAAGPYGLVIALEPLRRAECNIINSAREAVDLARLVNLPNIRVLLDYYHVTEEHEDAGVVKDVGADLLAHVHLANPKGRRYPKTADRDEYGAFFGALREIKYAGRISLEGATDDLRADAAEALEVLRHYG